MANHPVTSLVPPIPLINTPLLTPKEPVFIDITFNPSCQAPVDAPAMIISICHRVFYLCPIPEGAHVEQVTHLRPAMSFCLRSSLLLDRSRWQNVAYGILYYFSFNFEAYVQLLPRLYILGADWAEITLRIGCMGLDVAVEMLEKIEIDFPSLLLANHPESMPPLDKASIGQNMKLKEVSDIPAGETCTVCFEAFRGSTKEVTESPCSTCPLCRSSLRLP